MSSAIEGEEDYNKSPIDLQHIDLIPADNDQESPNKAQNVG